MAKCIMVAGTMSNVGKSIMAAGLCRIFVQDGRRVAPFKSQNMALNSYVTADGSEMSRAQALQAFACKKDPDVRMNPILLKPTGDMGSQVIINGKPIGDYRAIDYFKMKKDLLPQVVATFESLAKENDIIVIEGAGSPVELNLKDDDIVNMGLAKELNAPVILVGDIDPGGIFAQLYGTMELLEDDEKKLVIGTVINKFRGDIRLLEPGIKKIEELTGVKNLGVIPYMDLRLDDEDSLSDELGKNDMGRDLDIAVIWLPHISNYTDISPLRLHPDIGVRYVKEPTDIIGKEPDLIIIPGTKNTIDDLRWLKESGLNDAIKSAHDGGCAVLGICGGYQMLGARIDDPYGVEAGGSEDGLRLLPIETIFEKEKKTCRCEAFADEKLSSAHIRGYQIHNGRTLITEENVTPFCRLKDGDTDGVIFGEVYGTYLHGLFDTGELVSALADHLLAKKGMSPVDYKPKDFFEVRERELDKLADTLRKSLDMDAIYAALG